MGRKVDPSPQVKYVHNVNLSDLPLTDFQKHELRKGTLRIVLLAPNGCEVGAIVGKAVLREVEDRECKS